MSTEAQKRVLVIQDASREASSSAVSWALQGLSLKPGDKLIFLGILHQVTNPSTLSFMGAGKLLGYKIKVDSSSIFGTNKKIIAEEVAMKKEEYQNNAEIVAISKQCETEQIEFRIDVIPGSPSRIIAQKAAKRFKATWVVLDRHMKNDKRYMIENLSCGITLIKKGNNVVQLKGPKVREINKQPSERISNVSYDEMIPVMQKVTSGTPRTLASQRESFSHQKTSTMKEQGEDAGGEPPWNDIRKPASFPKSSSSENMEGSSSKHTGSKSSPLKFQEEGYTTTTGQETVGEHSPFSLAESGDQDQNVVYYSESPEEHQRQHSNNDDWVGGNPEDKELKNSICSICKNRRPKIRWQRDFTFAELQAATEGFNPKNFLSEGGFGSVYRGEIDGLKIAVKQHKSASFQGEKEFKSEVQVLSKVRHENLVMLLGSCSEGNHRLLVYEYVCNGSLDQHLSKHTRRPLSWEKRMKIATGAATGLQYLHQNNIIHRDMRPNNILVTHDFEPLLGDFGLARAQQEDSDHSSETRVVGTLGYLAPEYAECGKVSTKTDVYSFGVVLLQLITGLKTTDKRLGGRSLVGWARPLLKERNYPDLIDPRILESHDVHQLFWMVRVAEKCLSKDPQKRFSMDRVVSALNHIMDCNTICGIRDFSPAQSDTVSRDDSSESPGDDDSSFTVETASMSTISQMSVRLPPSPSIQAFPSKKSSIFTTYEESASGSDRYNDYLY